MKVLAQNCGRRSRSWVCLLSLSLLAVGCGATYPPTGKALPAYRLTNQSAFCSSSQVVDSERNVWFDSGCESPVDFHLVGTAEPASLQSLQAVFANLPATEPVPCAQADVNEASNAELSLTGADGGTVTWRVCLDDTGAPIEPFATAVALFGDLPKDT